MRGLDVVDVEVPEDMSQRPRFGPGRSGPKRKMTPKANTTISAVAVLRTDWNDELVLLIYHNRYAKNPIDPDWLHHPRVSHMRLRPGATSSADDAWEPA